MKEAGTAPVVAGETERLRVMDGLRGMAILLVVMTHSFLTGYHPAAKVGPVWLGIDWLVQAGSLGVELFFFISGFVLFIPFARAKLLGRPQPRWSRFADRRFIKIVPSYALALLAASFLFYQEADAERARWVLFFTHATFTHSFSPDTMFTLNAAFWSLAPEVQFYFFFPIIAVLMQRRPWLTYLVLLAVGEGFRLRLHATGDHEKFFWVCQLPAQIDLFALGMLCGYLYVALGARRLPSWTPLAATALAIAATIFGGWLLSDFTGVTKQLAYAGHNAWQNDHRLIVGFDIAALALSSLFAVPWWRAILANPLLLGLSTISYNLYLWHESVLVQCAKTGFPCTGIPTPWGALPHWDRDFFWGYLGISVLIAIVVTYGVERPLLRLGTRGAAERIWASVRSRIVNAKARA